MASPQKQMLLQMRKQREEREFYKPMGELPKGVKYPVTHMTTAKSEYRGTISYCLVVHYVMRSSKCFTYLTGQYKKPTEAEVKKMQQVFDTGITSKSAPLWFVYYGMANKAHEFDLLTEDEDINKQTMEECRLDEEARLEPNKEDLIPSPKKQRLE